jgi:hypothetical protein
VTSLGPIPNKSNIILIYFRFVFIYIYIYILVYICKKDKLFWTKRLKIFLKFNLLS